MHMKKRFLLTALIAFFALIIQPNVKYSLAGQEGPVKSITLPEVETKLKEGEGMDKAMTNCNICHSVDYITMQPPFPNAKWSEVVHKMINVFGAPISEDDAQIIINYLADRYGPVKKNRLAGDRCFAKFQNAFCRRDYFQHFMLFPD